MEEKEVLDRLKELLNNEKFVSDVSEAKDIETFTCLLKENGVNISDEEIEESFTRIRKIVESDELDDMNLEEVNGGALTVGVAYGFALFFVCVYSIYKGAKKAASDCRGN